MLRHQVGITLHHLVLTFEAAQDRWFQGDPGCDAREGIPMTASVLADPCMAVLVEALENSRSIGVHGSLAQQGAKKQVL